MSFDTNDWHSDIAKAAKKTAGYLYPIKGDVSPELRERIGILRQLINEEYVGNNRSVSSQLIYDILKPAIPELSKPTKKGTQS